MALLALGVSYRRAPVELLERLAFGEEEYPKAYHHLASLEAVRESVVLSTCNRVEVFASVTHYHQGFQDLKRFLSESRDVPMEEFAEPLYSHYEEQAVEHLFSVAGGIDSMVVGEPQILSQVREAFRRARTEDAAGEAMTALFTQAVRVGRRVRTETAIGASPAAYIEAGADLASDFLGGLEGCSLLVVGAGKMSELGVRGLRARGIGSVRILNRTPERAARIAATIGASSGGLGELGEALPEADLVVTSTGATGIVVGGGSISAAMTGREHRPLFLLDLAVPRDVDPGARMVPGVGVADIDDLRGLVANAAAAEEVEKGRAIVAEETRRFVTKQRAARFAPLIAALHARGEEVRAAELERLASKLSRLPGRDREAIEALTRRIVKTL
ncbi:MAG: glutamyl-tRNA reductase, partial [Actinomycetota bacterium]